MDFVYNVCCRFEDEKEALVEDWLTWLRDKHLADVCAGGAVAAQVLQLEDTKFSFEIRYIFRSREAFEVYEKEHAPRLRAEGLARFSPEHGVTYQRSTGRVVHRHTHGAQSEPAAAKN